MVDNAFPFMTMDILEQILDHADNPRQLSDFLVKDLRELLGAKIVLILESLPGKPQNPWKLTTICPERQRDQVDVPALYQLATNCATTTSTSFCQEHDHNGTAKLLNDGGWTNAAIMPLGLGSLQYGVLVLLDIVDPSHIGSLLQTLNPLGRIIGLVLKNSALYGTLEETVKHRTSQLSASELRFRTLTETAPVGVFRTDEKGKCEYVNEKWCAITGCAFNDAIGSGWAQTLHPDDRYSVLREWQLTVMQGRIFNLEYRFLRPDGQTTWVYGQAASVTDPEGKVIGYVGTITDITERIKQEADLRNLNEKLEQRVETRTQELLRTNGELQSALEQSQRLQEALIIKEKLASLTPMVAGVSHELNTPIGNIAVLSSALQERINDLNHNAIDYSQNPELANFMAYLQKTNDLIGKSASFAGSLVQSFKKVVVDREGAHRRNFKLAELVDDCFNVIRPNNKLSPWELCNEVPPDIELDSYPGALGQVIDNLVRNALIHAFEKRDHGRVSVKALLLASSIQKGGKTSLSRIRIEVRDNGKGIAQRHRHKIFDPFFTTHLGTGGSGLGLSITYNLVQQILGGTIAVESRSEFDGETPETCGTSFIIEIPQVHTE